MNAILSFSDQHTQGDFTVLSKDERLTKQMQEKLAMQATKSKDVAEADPLYGSDHQNLVSAALSQLIRYNTNLQHLDLRNTGLSEKVITGLVTALRHSKSLLSFHMG